MELKILEQWKQHVTEVHCKRGDAVIFCEAWCGQWRAHAPAAQSPSDCGKRMWRCSRMSNLSNLCFCSVHGALPWRGSHERRALLFRFNPGHSAYTPGLLEGGQYPDWVQTMTPEQQAVVSNPGWPSAMRGERIEAARSAREHEQNAKERERKAKL